MARIVKYEGDLTARVSEEDIREYKGFLLILINQTEVFHEHGDFKLVQDAKFGRFGLTITELNNFRVLRGQKPKFIGVSHGIPDNEDSTGADELQAD